MGVEAGDTIGEVFDENAQAALGFAEGFLGAHAVGDVGTGADPLAEGAVFFEQGDAADGDMAVVAGAGADTMDAFVDGAVFDGVRPDAGGFLAIVGMDHLEPAGAAGIVDGLAGVFGPGGKVDGIGASLESPDGVGTGVDEGAIALLAEAEGIFGALAVGDVVQDTGDTVDAARSVDGKVGDEHVPETQAGIGKTHFVLDDFAREGLIQLFLDDGFKDVIIEKVGNGAPQDMLFGQVAVLKVGSIGEGYAIIAVDDEDEFCQAFDDAFVFALALFGAITVGDVGWQRYDDAPLGVTTWRSPLQAAGMA